MVGYSSGGGLAKMFRMKLSAGEICMSIDRVNIRASIIFAQAKIVEIIINLPMNEMAGGRPINDIMPYLTTPDRRG